MEKLLLGGDAVLGTEEPLSLKSSGYPRVPQSCQYDIELSVSNGTCYWHCSPFHTVPSPASQSPFFATGSVFHLLCRLAHLLGCTSTTPFSFQSFFLLLAAFILTGLLVFIFPAAILARS